MSSSSEREVENYLADKDLEKVLKIYSKDQIVEWMSSVGPQERNNIMWHLNRDAAAVNRDASARVFTRVMVNCIRLDQHYKPQLLLLQQQSAELRGHAADIKKSRVDLDLLCRYRLAKLRHELADLSEKHADFCGHLVDLRSQCADVVSFQAVLNGILASQRNSDLQTRVFAGACAVAKIRGEQLAYLNDQLAYLNDQLAYLNDQLASLRGQFVRLGVQLLCFQGPLTDNAKVANLRSHLSNLREQLIFLHSQFPDFVQTSATDDIHSQLANNCAQIADIRARSSDIRLRLIDVRDQIADERRGRGH